MNAQTTIDATLKVLTQLIPYEIERAGSEKDFDRQMIYLQLQTDLIKFKHKLRDLK